MDMPSPCTARGERPGTRTLSLIGAASGIGCAHPTASEAPAYLRDRSIIDRLGAQGVDARWSEIIAVMDDTDDDAAGAISLAGRSLAYTVCDAVRNNSSFAVLGGDHSCAIGTWSGAANALRGDGPLGLIWVDAHMDSHTPETSPSGLYHGMPLACLLGYGDSTLTSIAHTSPALQPQHVAIVGVRSYEPEEAELLRRLGVRVFFMGEVEKRGLAAVMDDASHIAFSGTAGAGISIDLDALDPRDVSAVGSPEAGGLSVLDLRAALTRFAEHPRVVGCEITEFNPTLRGAVKTADIIEALLVSFQGRRA
jgi:arginase